MRKLSAIGVSGITGSRPENHCFETLKEKLSIQVTHHDLNTLPPFEIDITIPSKEVAVCWDGPFHRFPIFGQKKLDRVKKRDSRKHTQLLKMGWKIIVIEDNDKSFNPDFVEKKVNEIINLIDTDFKGKVILC